VPLWNLVLHNLFIDLYTQHILYLLIVNMPSEEEMAHALHVMDEVEQAQQQAT
jgi:hypothetical protein